MKYIILITAVMLTALAIIAFAGRYVPNETTGVLFLIFAARTFVDFAKRHREEEMK